jgi:hypothetical protein
MGFTVYRKLLLAGILCVSSISAFGFSLLGPYTPWMSVSNGYAQPGDLGGPMTLGHEYRWNLPVITYGFHPAFVEHFGSNGVRAVEAAVKILNRLPPASRIRLEEFPTVSTMVNVEAEALGLRDVKSFVLSHLLYQIGLAPSVRHIWIIRDRTNDLLEPYIIVQRNYDPVTLQPTRTVNGVQYVYVPRDIQPVIADVIEWPLDPIPPSNFSAITDDHLAFGQFYTGLTRDDVGGMRYLYSRWNVNIEKLPASVTRAGSSDRPKVNVAPRPGVEKLTFTRMTWNRRENRFNRITQRFTLNYYDRGVLKRQDLQRVVTWPDILFYARPLPPVEFTFDGNVYYYPSVPEATSAARWRNLSHLAGRAGDFGPGIIPPGAAITFDSSPPLPANPLFYTRWGSFDGTTNPPILFPPTFADP